jgi:hypothetical protein
MGDMPGMPCGANPSGGGGGYPAAGLYIAIFGGGGGIPIGNPPGGGIPIGGIPISGIPTGGIPIGIPPGVMVCWGAKPGGGGGGAASAPANWPWYGPGGAA